MSCKTVTILDVVMTGLYYMQRRARRKKQTTCLRGIIDDDCLGQVATQHRDVLQEIAVHRDAASAVHAVVDQAALWVQNGDQLPSIRLARIKNLLDTDQQLYTLFARTSQRTANQLTF